MRAMKSYDKILFKNNIATEEFVITVLRDETIEGLNNENDTVNNENDTVNLENDTVNAPGDTVNLENDTVNSEDKHINEVFECVDIENERVKNELMQIYSFIEQNPLVKIATIEKSNKKGIATVKRYLKILKNSGLIEYIGSDKTGGYRVVTKNNFG